MKEIKTTLFFGLLVTLICFVDLIAEETRPISVSGNVMVDVGDPGNVGYLLLGDYGNKQFGSVDYYYQIGKYEITVEDWFFFLTAVAFQSDQNHLVDAHHLWNNKMEPWITCTELSDGNHVYEVIKGKEKLPITYVSLFSAMRYCNWIEQGAPIVKAGEDIDAIIEHGSYNFSENGSVVENTDSHIYLPTQDEWVKAGYYAGGGRNVGYWEYPTQSNLNPIFNSDSLYRTYGQQLANYNGEWSSWNWSNGSYHPEEVAPLTLTDVNFFNNSHSYYGCRDMGGNVNEWTTTLDISDQYIVRGGSYKSSVEDLKMIPERINSYSSETESPLIGFRIVAKNLDQNDIFPNQTHDSKTAITVDHSVKVDQNQREEWELVFDLLGISLLSLLIFSIATTPVPSYKVLSILSVVLVFGIILYDIMRLLGLDYLRLITK